ncbi:MAG: hypothetical protein KGY50_05210 [Candidatus Thermoplasmatota archaeon]|nr:hypothetical protein [Candidatus Thermoplasmatota archaeon]
MTNDKKKEGTNGLFYPFYNPIKRTHPEEGVCFKQNGNDKEYMFEYEEGTQTLLNIGDETPILIPKNFLLPGDLEMYKKLVNESRNKIDEIGTEKQRKNHGQRGY